MREIKFRAWDILRSRMIVDAQDIYDLSIPADAFSDILHDEMFIVEQFTGLRDKNGVEIYEGDKIEFTETDRMPAATVVLKNGCFVAYDDLWETWNFLFSVHDRVIVTGNIHESPELLEKGK